MEIERKLKALDAVYAVYDTFARTQVTACSPRCTTCCTTHVTATTLEAYKIKATLPPGEWDRLSRRLAGAAAPDRFRPQVTTNGLAAICAAGGEPPAENGEILPATCPLLLDGLCSVYILRPFHCRCFVSRTPCAAGGSADVEEFVLSLNTVFLQTIEHLDADGCSGNLLDVLAVMAVSEKRDTYAAGALDCTENGLVANHPLRTLMLPVEHRARMEPILAQLRGIRV
jgi:hypothetical protein